MKKEVKIKAWMVIKPNGKPFRFVPNNEVWPTHFSSSIFPVKIDAEQIAEQGSYLENKRRQLKVVSVEIILTPHK